MQGGVRRSRRGSSATTASARSRWQYDFSGLDAEATKRRIQAGPLNIWRYADFLPFENAPRDARWTPA